MNFVLTWLWMQFSAGSTVVVIDQAWHCALRPAGNVWRKKRTKDRKQVAGKISKMKMSCNNKCWRSFAKNIIKHECLIAVLQCACLCVHTESNCSSADSFSSERKLKTYTFAWWDSSVTPRWGSISQTPHTLVFVSTVNKHKPWIETSYHGVITENTDIVLLDPPLVALDKDAPIPYAGMVHSNLMAVNCRMIIATG